MIRIIYIRTYKQRFAGYQHDRQKNSSILQHRKNFRSIWNGIKILELVTADWQIYNTCKWLSHIVFCE